MFSRPHRSAEGKGELRAEIVHDDRRVWTPYSRANGVLVHRDSTAVRLRSGGVDELQGLLGKPVRFRFYLTPGELYSFWVSSERSGASRGSVGAGGLGFSGAIDTVGRPRQKQ